MTASTRDRARGRIAGYYYIMKDDDWIKRIIARHEERIAAVAGTWPTDARG